jgi:uncharacterized protein (DUF3084 family)
MPDTNKILNIVLIAISLLVLYLIFTGNSKLNEAIKAINEVRDKVKIAKDSIDKAQNSIEKVLKKIEFTDNEMKILKADRDYLEVQEQKKRAANKKESEEFAEELKKIQDKRDSLKKEAQKFDL